MRSAEPIASQAATSPVPSPDAERPAVLATPPLAEPAPAPEPRDLAPDSKKLDQLRSTILRWMQLASSDMEAWGARGHALAELPGIWAAANRFYDSKDAAVRSAARQLALHFGSDPAAISLLARILAEWQTGRFGASYARTALRRLQEIDDPAVAGIVARFLVEVAPHTRVEQSGAVMGQAPFAILALGSIGGPEAGAALLDALDSTALAPLRGQIILQLRRTDAGAAVAPGLLERCRNLDADARRHGSPAAEQRNQMLAAVAALDGNEVEDSITAFLRGDASETAKIHLLGCIGGHGGERSLRIAERFSESESPTIRAQARFMLAHGGHAPTLSGLLATLESSASEREKELAAGLLGIASSVPSDVRRQIEELYLRGTPIPNVRAALAVTVARNLSDGTPEPVRERLRADGNDVVDGRVGKGDSAARLGGVAILVQLWRTDTTRVAESDLVAAWDRLRARGVSEELLTRAMGPAVGSAAIRSRVLGAADAFEAKPERLLRLLRSIHVQLLKPFQSELLRRLTATAGKAPDAAYAEALLRLGLDDSDTSIAAVLAQLSPAARSVFRPEGDDD